MSVTVGVIEEAIYVVELAGQLSWKDLLNHHEQLQACTPPTLHVVIIVFDAVTMPGINAGADSDYLNLIPFTYKHTILVGLEMFAWLSFESVVKTNPQITDKLYLANNLEDAIALARSLIA